MTYRKYILVGVFLSFSIVSYTHSVVDSLESLLESKSSLEQRVDWLNQLTKIYAHRDLKKALNYGQEASKIAANNNDKKGKLEAESYLANVQYVLQNYSEVITLADRVIPLSKELKLPKFEADAYFIKGRAFIQMGRKEQALALFKKCNEVSQDINYQSGIHKGIKGQGDLAENAGDFRQAKVLYKRALDHALLSKDPESLAVAYNDIGRIYDLNGEYDIGLNYYLQGARIAESNEMWNVAAGLLGNTGSLHYLMKNNEEALNYARQAVSLFKKVGNQKGEGGSNTTIGNVLFRQGKYNEALNIFTAVHQLRLETEDKRGLSFAYNNLGKTYAKLGDIDKGREYYKKSLQLKEELGLKFGVLTASRILAKSYLSTQAYENAITYAERSLMLAFEVGSYSELTASNGVLAEIYRQRGEYRKAYEYQKQYSIYKDSLLNEKKSRQINEIQTLYETEKNEKRIINQEKDILELERTKNKITTQRNYLMAGSISIGLLSIFGFQWNKVRKERNNKREFAEALIFAQEEERKRLARDLHDGVGQSLLLIKKQLESNSQTSLENNILIANTLQEVRSISQDLHPFQLEKFGLTVAIESVISNVERSTDLFVTKDIANIDSEFDSKAEINIFRTVQEALSNVVKHAEASAAKVSISKLPKSIKITIQDNGKGFDHEVAVVTSKSLGLRTMHERISALGGKLSFEKGKNEGSKVEIIIPRKV